MPSMRFHARLDTSHHGPPHPFKDARIFADSLRGIHTAFSLSTVTAYIKVFRCRYRQKSNRIQIWRGAWKPYSGSFCTYPSVMSGVTVNISHSAEHHHACASSFGRPCMRTPRQWLPVSRCGKTCRPTDH
jgi:hypothetical protein